MVAAMSDDSTASSEQPSKSVSKLEEENAKLRSLIKSLKQEKTQLKSNNSELDTQMKSMQKEHERTLNKKQNKIEKIMLSHQEVDEKRLQEICDLNNSLSTIRSSMPSLQHQLLQKNHELFKLKQSNTAQSLKLNAIANLCEVLGIKNVD